MKQVKGIACISAVAAAAMRRGRTAAAPSRAAARSSSQFTAKFSANTLPWAVAVSCLADLDPGSPLPPLTPYQLMKLGHLAVAPYAKPGSAELCAGVARLAPGRTALLMANHGSITGGASLTKALDAAEELEATCRLYLTLRGLPVRCLTPEQAAELLPPKGA